MKWTIEYTDDAQKTFLKLDRLIREQIIKYLKNLSSLQNPRLLGEKLKGNLSEFWKYRVGDYRLICNIQDEKLLVLIVKIGHRSEVYKKTPQP